MDIAWFELDASEEKLIVQAIDDNWEELNHLIDEVFAGNKIKIKNIK